MHPIENINDILLEEKEGVVAKKECMCHFASFAKQCNKQKNLQLDCTSLRLVWFFTNNEHTSEAGLFMPFWLRKSIFLHLLKNKNPVRFT
ncbi:hypothetical protein BUE76_16785 [Cnuella takakiae]|nr:hypothetical protein BUE76_16785 [Cnuella takakiae]